MAGRGRAATLPAWMTAPPGGGAGLPAPRGRERCGILPRGWQCGGCPYIEGPCLAGIKRAATVEEGRSDDEAVGLWQGGRAAALVLVCIRMRLGIHMRRPKHRRAEARLRSVTVKERRTVPRQSSDEYVAAKIG